jgi:hypothetical protein
MKLRPADIAEFIEWDVRNWSAALNFWLGHTTQDISQCSALELGSLNGGLSLWRYVFVAEMEEFLSPFSNVQYRTIGFSGAFGRSERQRKILGILDQTIFNYTIPNAWRYIMVGVARK